MDLDLTILGQMLVLLANRLSDFPFGDPLFIPCSYFWFLKEQVNNSCPTQFL